MDHSLKMVLLVLWGVITLTLSQEVKRPDAGAETVRKPGGCPDDVSDLPLCSELCADKDNCTTQNCVTDSQCDGSLKCCKTRCGTECLPPVFRSPCRDNFDCPWTLKCCSGVCDSDCVYQPIKQSFRTKGKSLPKQKVK